MPEQSWYRKDIGWWMVTLDGKKIRPIKELIQIALRCSAGPRCKKLAVEIKEQFRLRLFFQGRATVIAGAARAGLRRS
jgi:hypothetical protein